MEHVYVAERASGFNFTVPMEDAKGKETRHRVRFEKGQFKTDDDELAAAIDELMATQIGIRKHCRKAYRAAAEKLSRAQRKMMETSGAHKGGVTSDAAKQAMTDSLAQRDKQLRDAGVDKAAFAEDESLVLSEEAQETLMKPKAEEAVAKPVVEKTSGLILGAKT